MIMRMIRNLILFVILAPLAAHGATFRSIMAEWEGATRSEWVDVWGYPTIANDLVIVDDETLVYSYRSRSCRVSVTFEKDILTRWQHQGKKCPKHRRPKND